MYRQTKCNIYERDKVGFKQKHQGHNLCVVIIKCSYAVKIKKEEKWDNWNDTYFIGKNMPQWQTFRWSPTEAGHRVEPFHK